MKSFEREERFLPGTVAMVGAGPGAKALLTLRAVNRIQRADVILHDPQIEDEVLALALPVTLLLRVGRRANERAEIKSAVELMIAEAKARRRVVRLLGGNPSSARGRVELEALKREQIDVELVPGLGPKS